MKSRHRFLTRLLVALTTLILPARSAADVAVDLSGHDPASGVAVRRDDTRLRVTWPMAPGEHGVLVLQLRPQEPLIEELGIAAAADGPATVLLHKVNPTTWLTVGIRDLSKQGWNAFFDNPPRRPHETFTAVRQTKQVRVRSHGRRSTV